MDEVGEFGGAVRHGCSVRAVAGVVPATSPGPQPDDWGPSYVEVTCGIHMPLPQFGQVQSDSLPLARMRIRERTCVGCGAYPGGR